MELIRVTARFDQDGKITPIEFTWKNRRYKPDSVGRRWQDEKGAHILVMIPGGRVFELLFVAAEGCWYLARSGTGCMLA